MMDSFVLKSVASHDFEAVLALITAQNVQGYGEAFVTANTLRAAWVTLDLAQDAWVAVAPGGALAGYADLRSDEPGRFDAALYLAPGAGYVKAGEQLLQQAEWRAVARHGNPVGCALYGRASAATPHVLQSFHRAGYVTRLSFLMMERSLDSPLEPAVWPGQTTVGLFVREQDEQAVYNADEEAALDKGYHTPLTFEQWAERMNLNAASFDPGLWFVARVGGEVVGVALNYVTDAGVAWVDHLSVRRAWRGQGLGRALLLYSFAEFQRRGIDCVRLSVDSESLTNAPRLYERVGMLTTQEYHILKKICDSDSLHPFAAKTT